MPEVKCCCRPAEETQDRSDKCPEKQSSCNNGAEEQNCCNNGAEEPNGCNNGAELHNCCGRTKHRSEAEQRDLMNRLRRIEGQVRGVQKMLENDAYCPEIMVQVSAINSALNSFNKVLLASHMRSCVLDDIKAGRDEAIDELVDTLQKNEDGTVAERLSFIVAKDKRNNPLTVRDMLQSTRIAPSQRGKALSRKDPGHSGETGGRDPRSV